MRSWFRFSASVFSKGRQVRPLQYAEAAVAIEELSEFNYSDFADSQHVAVQDKCSEIAERLISALSVKTFPAERFQRN
jgi:hypothetical protein